MPLAPAQHALERRLKSGYGYADNHSNSAQPCHAPGAMSVYVYYMALCLAIRTYLSIILSEIQMHLFDVDRLEQTAVLDRANALLATGWKLVAVIPLSAAQPDHDGSVLYLLGCEMTIPRFGEGWGETIRLS